MSTGVERLKSEMAGLPSADRAEHASFLLPTLDSPEDEGVEAAWDEELRRRADEIRRGSATGVPAEQVFAEIRARYSR